VRPTGLAVPATGGLKISSHPPFLAFRSLFVGGDIKPVVECTKSAFTPTNWIDQEGLSLIPGHSNTDVVLLRGAHRPPLEEPREPHEICLSSRPEWQGTGGSDPRPFLERVPLLNHVRLLDAFPPPSRTFPTELRFPNELRTSTTGGSTVTWCRASVPIAAVPPRELGSRGVSHAEYRANGNPSRLCCAIHGTWGPRRLVGSGRSAVGCCPPSLAHWPFLWWVDLRPFTGMHTHVIIEHIVPLRRPKHKRD